MLNDLHTLTSEIKSGDLSEAEIYRRERSRLIPKSGRVVPGKLQCPICQTAAKEFLPFGLARRPNAQCPVCGSLERHRFLWLYLQQRTDFFRQRARMLHTAPEPALAEAFQTQHGPGYVGIDAFDPNTHVQANLKCLPFKASCFDIIISSHVLEHIDDDRPAIGELARVLQPSGWAVVMVPFDPDRLTYEDASLKTPAERQAVFGHPFHFRSYGSDLIGRLSQAGLKAEVVASKKFLAGEQRRRWRINRNYLLFCRK